MHLLIFRHRGIRGLPPPAIFLPSVLGAIAGAQVATSIRAAVLERVLGMVLLVLTALPRALVISVLAR